MRQGKSFPDYVIVVVVVVVVVIVVFVVVVFVTRNTQASPQSIISLPPLLLSLPPFPSSIRNCEKSPDYENTVKSIFRIVASFTDDKVAKEEMEKAARTPRGSGRGGGSGGSSTLNAVHEVVSSPRPISIRSESGTEEPTMDLKVLLLLLLLLILLLLYLVLV